MAIAPTLEKYVPITQHEADLLALKLFCLFSFIRMNTGFPLALHSCRTPTRHIELTRKLRVYTAVF